MTPVLGWVCGASLAFYAALLVLLTLLQRRLIFVPDRRPPGPPALAGVRALSVPTEDGLALLAWYAPAGDPAQPVVLYLHGNGSSIASRGGRMALMCARGWGVLLLEYRGYGGNAGRASEAGLKLDARAGLASLLEMGIAPSRIVLWGESLGSGLAVMLAAEHPVGAVILEAPYTSIAAIAKARFPFAPVDLLLRDRFDALARIGELRAPLLVMAGAQDSIVPSAMSQTMFDRATAPRQLWLSPSAGHNDLLPQGGWDIAAAFVERSQRTKHNKRIAHLRACAFSPSFGRPRWMKPGLRFLPSLRGAAWRGSNPGQARRRSVRCPWIASSPSGSSQ